MTFSDKIGDDALSFLRRGHSTLCGQCGGARECYCSSSPSETLDSGGRVLPLKCDDEWEDCDPPNLPDGEPEPKKTYRFNLRKFEQNIRLAYSVAPHTLGTTGTSYSYVISRAGTILAEYSRGDARRPQNTPHVELMPSTRMLTGSIAKTFTAVAVLQALRWFGPSQGGVHLGSSVVPFLPSYWAIPESNKQLLTFRRLLSHTAGLPPNYQEGQNTDIQSMRSMVEKGLSAPPPGVEVYANVNFGLFRIIIPYMCGGKFGEQWNDLQDDIAMDKIAAELFLFFINWHVFGKAFETPVTCRPDSEGQSPALWYISNDPSSGCVPPDFTHLAGAHGYSISALETGQFVSSLRAGKILDEKGMSILYGLDDGRAYGWEGTHDGEHGKYYYHGSRMGWICGAKRGGHVGGIVDFGVNNIQAVLLTNSVINYDIDVTADRPDDILMAAFDDAWVWE